MAEMTFTKPPLMGGDATRCRVFIPCHTNKFDLSDLKRFGTQRVTMIERHAIYPDDPVAEDFIHTLQQRLDEKKFNTASDYVALLGDALISALVCMTLGRYFDNVVFLRYDTQGGGYWPCKVY